jgi:hypothetical protein
VGWTRGRCGEEIYKGLWLENPKELIKAISLKWMLKEYDGRVHNGFICFIIGTIFGLL